MSVSLATQNPEAYERLAANAPLPGLGDVVIYRLRPGEIRAGVREVMANVLKVDEANRLLKLLVIFDHQDMQTLENVPQQMGEDRGWRVRDAVAAAQGASPEDVAAIRQELVALNERLEAFKIELGQYLLGDGPKPDVCLEDRLTAICDRLDRIESAPAPKAVKAKPKRKRK